MDSKLTMLMILDGFGENNHKDGNAVKLANTPNIDKLMNIDTDTECYMSTIIISNGKKSAKYSTICNSYCDMIVD